MNLLCIDTSASFSALISQIAESAGLNTSVCLDAGSALACINSNQPFAMMIVANQLNDTENGISIIRSARLHANRATMPIIFMMTARDRQLAHTALQSGATEVILRKDIKLLGAMLSEHSSAARIPVQTGRVLLVEDSKSQADYVETLCTALGLKVDRCASAEAGMEHLRNNIYQIAIIDIVLEGIRTGLSLVRHIRQLSPPKSQLPILIMTGFSDTARRIEALRVGADDFINKPFVEDEFVWRIQRIIESSVYKTLCSAEGSSADDLADERPLTLRENEICQALMLGVSDKQIANDLGISFWTVRTHIGNIFAKLGVLNRRELMMKNISTDKSSPAA